MFMSYAEARALTHLIADKAMRITMVVCVSWIITAWLSH